LLFLDTNQNLGPAELSVRLSVATAIIFKKKKPKAESETLLIYRGD